MQLPVPEHVTEQGSAGAHSLMPQLPVPVQVMSQPPPAQVAKQLPVLAQETVQPPPSQSKSQFE